MPSRNSGGAGLGLLFVSLGVLLIFGPSFLSPYLTISGYAQIVCGVFGLLLLLIGSSMIMITKLYVRALSDQAFVRTGMGGAKAIIDGGALVFPVVHQVTPVTLQTIKLDVNRSGKEALITGDNLRADVVAEFFINVAKAEKDVLQASKSFGYQANDREAIEKLVQVKLINALRTVAATQDLDDLNSKRDVFAAAVKSCVETDLVHNGLTLETVTISSLDQTAETYLNPKSNVFDAQGAKKLAEVTNSALVARNKIETAAASEVQKQNVERDKLIYEQEVARAEAEAKRDLNMRNAKTEADQKALSFKAEQDRLSQTAEVERAKAIEVTELQKAQAVQVANEQREQAARVAEVTKQRAIEIAEREKQIAVAAKEKERADAEALRLAAEAEREKEHQNVLKVEIIQTAEREKEREVIAKMAEIEKRRKEQEMLADLTAYTADQQAKATLTKAESEKRAAMLKAEGDFAEQRVPVDVEREQVNVEQARVNVGRQELENKSNFETISRGLTVELARIAMEKEVRIALANSMGNALSKTNMTVWGDPNTVSKMMESFTSGQLWGKMFDGFMDGTSDEVKNMAYGLAGGLGNFGSALIKRLTGNDVDPRRFEKELFSMASNVNPRVEKSGVESGVEQRETEENKTRIKQATAVE